MGVKDRRKEVEAAILGILETNLSQVSWKKMFKGFQREKGVSGSLVNFKTDFERDSKDKLKATAVYSIILADPDNTDTVDDIADDVFDLLDNDDLDGVITVGDVKSIYYGAAPNKAEAGSVLMVYQVQYYVE